MYVAKVAGGDAISGSTSLYVDISSLTGAKPIISSFNVVENGSGDGKVKITFNASSSTSLTMVRAHCSTSSLVSDLSSYFYKWKDTTTSTGSKTIYLNNNNWIGKRVYCKAQVEAGAGNKADIIIDNVNLSDSKNNDIPIIAFDSNTNLRWAIITGDASWRNSISVCEALVTDESSTWRTPNINELYSIVDISKSSKFVKNSINAVESKTYWSSTTNPNNPSQAMTVNFSESSTYSATSSKNNTRGVICVK